MVQSVYPFASQAPVLIKGDPVVWKTLEVPEGVQFARNEDGIREVLQYTVNSDAVTIRWDGETQKARYFVIGVLPDDVPLADWDHPVRVSIRARAHLLLRQAAGETL